MDKVLAFSIMSASPADIAAGAGLGRRWTRLSWRRSADDQGEPTQARRQRDKEEGSRTRSHDNKERARAEKMAFPRFAPEFDGIDCFETIVSH
ncbi:uncharacterized protein LOC133930918 [Phragmites australis]|uniref:uncharacterized protein LOC133930918 n=1 Tax=Phragmites australis TaxID=29695 RepID=UPI002D76EDEB|nr:uncharacterized protein LOC133930918 [Phragmites australis]